MNAFDNNTDTQPPFSCPGIERVDDKLIAYVEREIMPLYDSFDCAHRPPHIRKVMEQSLFLAGFYPVDYNMVYTIAAYHDTGVVEGREKHHLVSGKIIRNDRQLRRWFTEEQIEVMACAAEDHRASGTGTPRTIYGKIVAEADRDIDPLRILERTVQYGMEYYPEYDKNEHYRRFVEHLHQKYAEGGYLKLFLPESPNKVGLETLRGYIKNEAFIKQQFDLLWERLKKKRIFLTGATGVMGTAGVKELLQRSDRFDLTLLVRPSVKNRRKLRPILRQYPKVHVIWGDLLRYEDVFAGVAKADYVLHVGGMVSPLADHYPDLTLKVNVTAAQHIAKAVQEVEAGRAGMPRQIKVVYIGSVAQYGDRMPPHHWGSTEDPLCPVPTDTYARSKVLAEEVIAKGGLSHWVSLRQSGIIDGGLLRKATDPITFHVPLNGVLEWSTVEDSGRLLAQVCEDFVPESFWNRYYNISSGAAYRFTNYEFEKHLLHAIYCPPPEKIFKPQWFAAGHFHGMWYTDADALEQVLHFRENISATAYFERFRKQLPWFFPLARFVPACIIRAFMAAIARKARKELGSNFGSPLTDWSEVVQHNCLLAPFGS